MNTIAIVIGIKVNDQKIYAVLPNVGWPTKATLKALVRFKLAELKRELAEAFNKLAMAIIPMPQCAAA